MTPSATSQRDRIERALVKSAGKGKLFALFIFLLAFIGPIRFIPEWKYALAVITFLGMTAVAALIWWLAGLTDPRKNPTAQALLNHPETVTGIEHYTSSGADGSMQMQWLRVSIEDQSFGLRVDEAEIVAFAELLAEFCPNAEVTVPGFRRPS